MERQQANPVIIGPAEVAKMLNLHERTVRRKFESGELPGRRIAGQWKTTPEAIYKLFDFALPSAV